MGPRLTMSPAAVDQGSILPSVVSMAMSRAYPPRRDTGRPTEDKVEKLPTTKILCRQNHQE